MMGSELYTGAPLLSDHGLPVTLFVVTEQGRTNAWNGEGSQIYSYGCFSDALGRLQERGESRRAAVPIRRSPIYPLLPSRAKSWDVPGRCEAQRGAAQFRLSFQGDLPAVVAIARKAEVAVPASSG
jgi:hypothetical protein